MAYIGTRGMGAQLPGLPRGTWHGCTWPLGNGTREQPPGHAMRSGHRRARHGAAVGARGAGALATGHAGGCRLLGAQAGVGRRCVHRGRKTVKAKQMSLRKKEIEGQQIKRRVSWSFHIFLSNLKSCFRANGQKKKTASAPLVGCS